MNSLHKYGTSIQSRIRSGSNKENQAPTGGNLRSFKNHHSAGPIGVPLKAKNSNSLHFHNHEINNLLLNQTNQHHFDKLNLHIGLNNNSSNINLNNPNASFLSNKTNATCLSADEAPNPLSQSTNNNSLRNQSNVNQLSLSINSDLSTQSNNYKLSDLYRPHLTGSSSSLQSYSSNENFVKEDKRFLTPPPKQNIMYHEQR